MPSSLRRICGDGVEFPSRSTIVACSSGCRPGSAPSQPGGSRAQSTHCHSRQDEVRSPPGGSSRRRYDHLGQSRFSQAHGDRARQKLQRRTTPENQRQDRDPSFGDDRILLHLSSRNDGVAERCKMIGPARPGLRALPWSVNNGSQRRPGVHTSDPLRHIFLWITCNNIRLRAVSKARSVPTFPMPSGSAPGVKGGRNMKRRRQADYHGSRSYGGDEPAGSRLRLDLTVLAGWARQQLEKLMRAGAPQADEFRTLVHAGEKNFSVLGAANENRREIATSIWPSPAGQTRERSGRARASRKDLDAGSQPRV